MQYLITGGAGFIGSHLVDKLIELGEDVIVLDDLSTGQVSNINLHTTVRRVPRYKSNLEFVHGSILNSDLVDDCVRRSDSVLHLAAAVGVNNIIDKPLESLSTNIRGSEIILEKCHKYTKPVLVTSTSEIYGKNTSDCLMESDDRILGSPLNVRWSYSEAKAVEEVLAYSYWRSKGLPARIVRLFNTVGPRQVGFYGMVVPRFVEAALKNEDITVYGDGSQTRCFGHVDDITDGILMVLNSDATVGKVLNIGNNEEISILNLAKRVVDMTNSNSNIVFVPYKEAYGEGFEDMERRVPGTQLISSLVGWKATKDLNQILRDVVTDVQSRI